VLCIYRQGLGLFPWKETCWQNPRLHPSTETRAFLVVLRQQVEVERELGWSLLHLWFLHNEGSRQRGRQLGVRTRETSAQGRTVIKLYDKQVAVTEGAVKIVGAET
jgi:hypothetical protein